MSARYLFRILLCAGLATGCTDHAPTRLSSAQMEALDSLFTIQMPLVRQEADSLCDIHFEQRLRRLVDSLLIARREEEARLRQRIPKQ